MSTFVVLMLGPKFFMSVSKQKPSAGWSSAGDGRTSMNPAVSLYLYRHAMHVLSDCFNRTSHQGGLQLAHIPKSTRCG